MKATTASAVAAPTHVQTCLLLFLLATGSFSAQGITELQTSSSMAASIPRLWETAVLQLQQFSCPQKQSKASTLQEALLPLSSTLLRLAEGPALSVSIMKKLLQDKVRACMC